jgi:hypothetical protein
MLINLEPFGRLGNRLFLAAHLVAFSEHFQVPVLNLGMGEYVNLFPWMAGNAAFAYPWAPTGSLVKANVLRAVHSLKERFPWSRRFHHWEGENYVFDDGRGFPYLDELRRQRAVYFRAWLFRGFTAVAEHRSKILEIFHPAPEVCTRAEAFLGDLRSAGDLVIGVHVRWQDYRGTDNFFSLREFQEVMQRCLALFPTKRIVFAVFSNEALGPDGFPGLSVRLANGAPIEDLTAMAGCDLLIGPPSTFSGWASFYGEVPLLTLRHDRMDFCPDDFQVVRG